MAAIRSGSRTGDVAGGPRVDGMTPTLAYRPMPSNPTEAELRDRTQERTELLRTAVNYTARQLLMAVPPMLRSKAEAQLLYDCVKGRRGASDATLVALMDIQARADVAHAHTLSEQIRALELRGRSRSVPCVFEASEAEQAHDAELDLAQLAAARHKTPTYWQAVREKAIAHMAALRALIDATARYATPTRTA